VKVASQTGITKLWGHFKEQKKSPPGEKKKTRKEIVKAKELDNQDRGGLNMGLHSSADRRVKERITRANSTNNQRGQEYL